MSIQVAFEAVQLTNGQCAVMAINRSLVKSDNVDVCVATRPEIRGAVRLARKLNDVIDAEGGYGS